jgi:hypothetical protein
VNSVFFSYSHADEDLRDQLEKQLAMLKRQDIITTWYDRCIGAGHDIDGTIDANIETASIILLLVSPDFIASDYCYNREMIRAMERHAASQAIVIPVILRACDWHHAPFGKLLATPTDGRPVTQWPDRDQAFLEVAKAIRRAAELQSRGEPAPSAVTPAKPIQVATVAIASPRSSNLRLTKQFTERDKDAFKLETFEFIANYFSNSIDELQDRNPSIEASFRRIDANRFGSTVYRYGKAEARCTIFMGARPFVNGIAYSASETGSDNSYNECLHIEADDQMLFLRGMGMSHMRSHSDTAKLSQEGAAEFFWGMLIEPLQREGRG